MSTAWRLFQSNVLRCTELQGRAGSSLPAIKAESSSSEPAFVWLTLVGGDPCPHLPNLGHRTDHTERVVDDFPTLDITFDGADDVDRHLNAIKGGGACHRREKVVAEKSREFVCARPLSQGLLYAWFLRFRAQLVISHAQARRGLAQAVRSARWWRERRSPLAGQPWTQSGDSTRALTFHQAFAALDPWRAHRSRPVRRGLCPVRPGADVSPLLCGAESGVRIHVLATGLILASFRSGTSTAKLRMGSPAKAGPVVTDNGNLVLDATFPHGKLLPG